MYRNEGQNYNELKIQSNDRNKRNPRYNSAHRVVR